VEDTDWTLEMLREEGFSEEIIHLVDLLTHDPEKQTYEQYIEGIKDSPRAVKVKRADLRHNSNITRMKGLKERDFKRLAKYHKAYEKLRYK